MKWAARLPFGSLATLDPLRLAPGLEWREEAGEMWVRGAGEIPQTVPWSGRYEVRGDRALHEPGRLLPAGELPAEGWRPLAEGLMLAPPPLAIEGLAPAAVAIGLARSQAVGEPSLLELGAAEWRAYGEHAPAIRLAPLEFARTETGRVYVRGRPLPSLRGARFVVEENVATPAGLTWAPPVTAATLRAALQLGEGEMVVLLESGMCRRIPNRAWSPAARALIRAA